MSNSSGNNSSGDSIGTNVLTVTVIVGSVLLLLAALAGPAPVRAEPAAQAAKPAIEHVVVSTAHAGHVS
jgi:hypothetical protein